MKSPKLLFVLTALLLGNCAFAQEAKTTETYVDKAVCTAEWDETFFYISYKVDCPDVQSKCSKPNAEISGDDMVELYLDTTSKRPEKIGPTTVVMKVSASGGSRFYRGNDEGKLVPEDVFSYKYGANVQGTVNNSDDVDMGYSVEIAIPWDLMKTKNPALGETMAFNLIIRRNGDKGCVWLSPKIESEEDILSPAKWSNVVFAAHSFAASNPDKSRVLATKYVVKAPTIDGRIDTKEWNKNTAVHLDMPMAGVVYEAKFALRNMNITPYEYTQGPDSAFKVTPECGVGMWMDYNRVGYHTAQLSDMTAAGIDTFAPVYRFGDDAKYLYGLDCVAGALGNLKSEGKNYPSAAMFIDGASLKDGDFGQDMFYAAVREFFTRIPEEFRAAAQTKDGKRAVVVFVTGMKDVKGADGALLDYCSEKFLADFGEGIVWVADESFPECGAVEGVVSLAGDKDANGRVYIESNLITSAGSVNRPDKSTLWMFRNGWNNYSGDNVIAKTIERGGEIAEAVSQNGGRKTLAAQPVYWNIPAIMTPTSMNPAEVTLRNNGLTTWKAGEGFDLVYSWYRSGRFYGNSKVRRPLERDVAPGQIVTVPFGVATIGGDGTPLPEGSSELRIDIFSAAENKTFTAMGDKVFMVPVTIAAERADKGASYSSFNVPLVMATSEGYIGTVKAYNLGKEPWKKDKVYMGVSLYKVSGSERTAVPIKRIIGKTDADCAAGEAATFAIPLLWTMGDKEKPEPSPKDGSWHYELTFDIFDGEGWMADSGTPAASRYVILQENDYSPVIADVNLPEKLTPDSSVATKVVLRNAGVSAWPGKKTGVGYHWYTLDGKEVYTEANPTVLAKDFAPGMAVVFEGVNIKTPSEAGDYVLVMDMMFDGKYFSESCFSENNDILVRKVKVGE
ncbi:MAG: hypothetical protein J6332_04600 [Abditibacteriota bacterium]|nr:hypothetical protein [Abditibacteriota bacterium]